MEFYTKKVRVSKSAYTRDRVNPITGERCDIALPGDSVEQVVKKSTKPIEQIAIKKVNVSYGRGENIDYILPMKHYSKIYSTTDADIEDSNAKHRNPIPTDDHLSGESFTNLTTKVNEFDEKLSLEERLARINLTSLRPKQPPPSPFRQEKPLPATPHVLDTPWDVVPEHIVHGKATNTRIRPEDINVAAGMASTKLAAQRIVALSGENNEVSSAKKYQQGLVVSRQISDTIMNFHKSLKFKSEIDIINKVQSEVAHISKLKAQTEEVIMDSALNTKNNLFRTASDGSSCCEQITSARGLHHSDAFEHDNGSRNLFEKNMIFFQARIISSNGRDNIRDLTGFYFTLDESFAIYECREFNGGLHSNVLPFIDRACYSHCSGSRRGQPYLVTDICMGNVLTVMNEGQRLPGNLQNNNENTSSSKLLTMIITYVDQAAKENILLSSLCSEEKEQAWETMHYNREENRRLRMQHDIQRIVRDQIDECGIDFYMSFGRLLRSFCERGDRIHILNCEKLFQIFGIKISSQMLTVLWAEIDDKKTKYMDCAEFRRSFIGEMPETCMYYVKMAFKKMDINKIGKINITEIMRSISAFKNSGLLKGKMDIDELNHAFDVIFQKTTNRNEITFGEFEDMYQGLYMQLDDITDSEFNNIIVNTYTL